MRPTKMFHKNDSQNKTHKNDSQNETHKNKNVPQNGQAK